MVCSECKRSATTDVCTGCRTLSRLKWLWQTQIGVADEAEALSCLRNCAGGLTDLREQRASLERLAAVRAPETLGVEGEAKATKREEAAPGGGSGEAESALKGEDLEPVKEETDGSGSYSYESEEVKEPPKPLAETPRFGRGSLGKPLGLTPASKPSTKKPPTLYNFRGGRTKSESPRRDDERKRRDASPKRKESTRGGDEASRPSGVPRPPDHPPKHHRDEGDGHRSRSRKKHRKKKSNKGKTKRERGREFRKARQGHPSSGAWHRR